MLDSNVHDLIVANPRIRDAINRRINSGALKLITTHVQRDELSSAPADKREALLCIYGQAMSVHTSGAVWGVSNWGAAKYGSPNETSSINAIMSGNRRHAEDALIASTADGEADVLVTDETRLHSKIRRAGFTVKVWSWGQFVAWLDQ
jgi:hypothetical protein